MGKLHINLLDTSFTIQASEDSEYLEKLLGYYERIVKDVQKIDSVKTPLQTSILSGIMLCDELYKAKTNLISMKDRENSEDNTEQDLNSAEIEEHTKKMIEKIDKVL